MKQFDTSLYFITDSGTYEEAEFLARIEAALCGGVTILQLRERNKTTREYISLAEKVHKLTKEHGVPLIIDDRVDVALAVDAEGVHLGAENSRTQSGSTEKCRLVFICSNCLPHLLFLISLKFS